MLSDRTLSPCCQAWDWGCLVIETLCEESSERMQELDTQIAIGPGWSNVRSRDSCSPASKTAEGRGTAPLIAAAFVGADIPRTSGCT
jgi:hypothetical protein